MGMGATWRFSFRSLFTSPEIERDALHRAAFHCMAFCCMAFGIRENGQEEAWTDG